MPHFFKKLQPAHFLLIGVLVLGILLRFWQLGGIPTVLNRDEAALAYNALLLKEVGQDEWQRSWPLALESFGDYKLPGYVVSLVASFSVFGYHDWVVKLPSAVAGSALILLTYFYLTRLFHQSRQSGVFGAGLVAFTPVFFFYSRIAFEANMALTLFLAGMFCLLLETNTWTRLKSVCLRLVGIVLLLLAVFTYNTPLLLLPLLLPVVVMWHGWNKPKRWAVPVIGMLLVIIAGFASLLTLSQQKSGITIFADEDTWLQSVQYRQEFSGIAQKVLGNKVVFFAQIIGKHVLASFSPTFLVTRGGEHPWHSLPGFAHLVAVTYFLMIVGIVASLWLFIHKDGKHFVSQMRIQVFSRQRLVALWLFLFITLAPASITVDAPHATRSLVFFWVLLLLAVFGAQTLWRLARLRLVLRLVVVGLAAIFFLETAQYFLSYFQMYSVLSTDILHGKYETALQITQSRPDLEKVAVIDGGGYQYILTAWYVKMSPAEFFATVQRHLPDRIGFRYGYKVGKYRFVVSPNDRFPEEKALLFWDSSIQGWQVRTEF